MSWQDTNQQAIQNYLEDLLRDDLEVDLDTSDTAPEAEETDISSDPTDSENANLSASPVQSQDAYSSSTYSSPIKYSFNEQEESIQEQELKSVMHKQQSAYQPAYQPEDSSLKDYSLDTQLQPQEQEANKPHLGFQEAPRTSDVILPRITLPQPKLETLADMLEEMEKQQKALLEAKAKEKAELTAQEATETVEAEPEIETDVELQTETTTEEAKPELEVETNLETEVDVEISIEETETAEVKAEPETEEIATEVEVEIQPETQIEVETEPETEEIATEVEVEPEIQPETETAEVEAEPEVETEPLAAEEVVPAATPELVDTPAETPIEVASPDEPPMPPSWENGRPIWAQERFECLLFKVKGLTLAVPLVELGGIIKIEDEPTPLFGQPNWFMGLLRTNELNVAVVDTAQWVLPPTLVAQRQEKYELVIRIHNSHWGLACNQVDKSISLEPDQVRWRSSLTQRPWLAGTVIDHMCALIDAAAFARLLRDGHGELKPANLSSLKQGLAEI